MLNRKSCSEQFSIITHTLTSLTCINAVHSWCIPTAEMHASFITCDTFCHAGRNMAETQTSLSHILIHEPVFI